MKIVTAEEMKAIDRSTIEDYGIPGPVLMERAGLAVVRRIREQFGRKNVTVFAGGGNNGGDGMVVARNLHNCGWKVRVFLLANHEDLRGDAALQYRAGKQFGVCVEDIDAFFSRPTQIFGAHGLIVDALFGTGLTRPVSGRAAEIIRIVNAGELPVVSVDIPSGVSADTGKIMGEAIRAAMTVTFGLPKRGHFLHPGAELSGKLFVEDIGFPSGLSGDISDTELMEQGTIRALLPKRKRYSHKGDYGHVLIVAGSRGKTGAAIMAARACLRAGAGLVTIGVPESIAGTVQSRVTEEMVLALPDSGDGTLAASAAPRILSFMESSRRVLAIGPGIGVNGETSELMKEIVLKSSSPVVIDADGLNSLQGFPFNRDNVRSPLILTPHPGEMARLLSAVDSHSSPVGIEVEADRIETARSFAGDTGTFLVLKGTPTVIGTPEKKIFLNPTGNPGMASAGTGDILTGIIAALVGQTENPLHACMLGVYLHGLSGDLAAREKGHYSLVATDIIEKLPAAFSHLQNHEQSDLS